MIYWLRISLSLSLSHDTPNCDTAIYDLMYQIYLVILDLRKPIELTSTSHGRLCTKNGKANVSVTTSLLFFWIRSNGFSQCGQVVNEETYACWIDDRYSIENTIMCATKLSKFSRGKYYVRFDVSTNDFKCHQIIKLCVEVRARCEPEIVATLENFFLTHTQSPCTSKRYISNRTGCDRLKDITSQKALLNSNWLWADSSGMWILQQTGKRRLRNPGLGMRMHPIPIFANSFCLSNSI